MFQPHSSLQLHHHRNPRKRELLYIIKKTHSLSHSPAAAGELIQKELNTQEEAKIIMYNFLSVYFSRQNAALFLDMSEKKKKDEKE